MFLTPIDAAPEQVALDAEQVAVATGVVQHCLDSYALLNLHT